MELNRLNRSNVYRAIKVCEINDESLEGEDVRRFNLRENKFSEANMVHKPKSTDIETNYVTSPYGRIFSSRKL